MKWGVLVRFDFEVNYPTRPPHLSDYVFYTWVRWELGVAGFLGQKVQLAGTRCVSQRRHDRV